MNQHHIIVFHISSQIIIISLESDTTLLMIIEIAIILWTANSSSIPAFGDSSSFPQPDSRPFHDFEISSRNNIYCVDFDQTLLASAKYDDFMKATRQKYPDPADKKY